MKLNKALKLAIQALHEAQKPLHFDANMLDHLLWLVESGRWSPDGR